MQKKKSLNEITEIQLSTLLMNFSNREREKEIVMDQIVGQLICIEKSE